MLSNLTQRAYKLRFHLLLSSYLLILFGSLFFPEKLYQEYISDLFVLFNTLAGINLIHKRKKTLRICIALLIIVFSAVIFHKIGDKGLNRSIYFIYFLYFLISSLELYRQIWKAKKVSTEIILAVFCGLVVMGLMGNIVFILIETRNSGSFANLPSGPAMYQDLMYFSYISLLTIGYGDIYPVTPIAKKFSVLFGLLGQFYSVVITAIVVGKYLTAAEKKNND